MGSGYVAIPHGWRFSGDATKLGENPPRINGPYPTYQKKKYCPLITIISPPYFYYVISIITHSSKPILCCICLYCIINHSPIFPYTNTSNYIRIISPSFSPRNTANHNACRKDQSLVGSKGSLGIPSSHHLLVRTDKPLKKPGL